MNGNSVINGFTIQNGSGTLIGNGNYGGGIHITSNDTNYILNCVFSNNDLSSSSDSRGGGINGNAHTFIDKCIFSDNFVTQYGSAVAGGHITNCVFENNGQSTVCYPRKVSNCLFVNNGASTIAGFVPPANYDTVQIINNTLHNSSPNLKIGANANLSNVIQHGSIVSNEIYGNSIVSVSNCNILGGQNTFQIAP